MMKKIWYLALCAIILAALFLAGCTPKAQPTPNPITTNPPTAAPVAATPTTPPANAINRSLVLDPAVTEDADSLMISGYVYDGLTKLDASGKPQAALAASWTISDDQMDYVVTLRQDVTFHSGAKVNADAVMANFNRWFDPQDALHGSATYATWKKIFLGFKGETNADGTPASTFDGIEKVDEHTVLLHLNKPMPDLLTDLANPAFSILNPAVLAQSGVGTTAETVDGTGAYFVDTWNNDGLALTPNASYWGGAPASALDFPWK